MPRKESAPFLQQQTNDTNHVISLFHLGTLKGPFTPRRCTNPVSSAVGSVMLVVSTLSWFSYGSVMVVVFVTQLKKQWSVWNRIIFHFSSCSFSKRESLHEEEKVLKPAPSPELIQCQEPNKSNNKTRSQVTCLHSHVSLSDLLSGCNKMSRKTCKSSSPSSSPPKFWWGEVIQVHSSIHPPSPWHEGLQHSLDLKTSKRSVRMDHWTSQYVNMWFFKRCHPKKHNYIIWI